MKGEKKDFLLYPFLSEGGQPGFTVCSLSLVVVTSKLYEVCCNDHCHSRRCNRQLSLKQNDFQLFCQCECPCYCKNQILLLKNKGQQQRQQNFLAVYSKLLGLGVILCLWQLQ